MPLANRVLAGGNRAHFHSATDGTTPSVSTTVAMVVADDILQTTVDRDEATGAYNMTLEHVLDTQTLYTFFETYTSVTTSGAIEELLLEDGVKEQAVTSSNQTLIGITRGGLAGATTGNARKVGAFPVRLKNNVGGWTQQGETYNRVTFEAEGFKLSGALTLVTALFTSISTTPTQLVLSTSFPYGRVTFQ